MKKVYTNQVLNEFIEQRNKLQYLIRLSDVTDKKQIKENQKILNILNTLINNLIKYNQSTLDD